MSENDILSCFDDFAVKKLNDYRIFTIKTRKHKQIETLISQLDGQFSMNINFSKTFEGLKIGILSKITAITVTQ
jgi:hypothetical protein